MTKINCIIVEDEEPAIEELKYILSKYNFINILDTANNGVLAYNLVEKYNPDLVFMDINIPSCNGMNTACKIKNFNKDIDIVFISAYEEYAIQAFEIDALDYILKPFDEKRIKKTIDRLLEQINLEQEEKVPKVLSEILNRLEREEKLSKKIACENNGKIILIDIKNICYCYTLEEKTYVKTKQKEYITNNTLKEIQLKTNLFRIHRSYIVNLDHIKELYSWFNGTYKIIMDTKEECELPVSRNNVKRIKELLGI